MRKGWTLTVAILGSGIVYLDSTIVNVALPRIGRELPTTVFGVLEGQSYVYNSYLLSLSALLILAGALSDFYGRKRMFAVGLGGFGVTSVLCGVAPTMEALVLFRLLQGMAGALLVPGSLALITAAYSGQEQGRAFGLWAAASAGTTVLGPFIGGLMVDTVSWRLVFLINAPLVAVGLWATLRHVRESRDERAEGQFDWVGSVIVALAVGGLAFGAIYGQQRSWRDPLAYGALGAGVIATLVLPLWMARAPHPLVPMHMFRSRNFTVTNLSTLVIYGALYVTFYNAPIYLQGTLGYTAAAVGLATIPTSLLLAALSSFFGSLAGRHGPRLLMAIGPAVMGLGVLWFTRIPSASDPWLLRLDDPASFIPPTAYLVDILPGMLVFGLGAAVMVAPLTTALMTSVPERNAGVASAINNAISRVGPQLAGAMIFVAITYSFYQGLADRVPGLDVSDPNLRAQISPLNRPAPEVPPELVAAARRASTEAFHLSMYVGAGLLFSGALINFFGIRNEVVGRDMANAADEPLLHRG